MKCMTSTAARTTASRPVPASYADLPRLMSLMTGDAKHDQAATSTLDVLWVLYDRVLRVTPQTAADDTRDRFLLSKGHGPMAYYAVLAAKGFLDPAELPSFGSFGSVLGLHPDHAGAGRGDLQRLARPRAAAGCGHGPRPARPAADRRAGCSSCSATASWTRARTTRRSRSPARAAWTR